MPDISTIIASIKAIKYEKLLNDNKIPITIALLGLIVGGLGVFLYKNTSVFEGNEIEILELPTEAAGSDSPIVAEIAGSIEKPGVYTLPPGSRINDLLVSGGGLSADADRVWVEKYVNRAAKLADGQKLYIKSVNSEQRTVNSQQTDVDTANTNGGYQNVSGVLGVENGGLLNINTATFAELDKLPGIGQVYGQKIIEQRPYSDVSELLSRGILPKTTYEKIKDLVTTY